MQDEGGDISVLPEGCISTILSFTSPSDAGVSSLVSSTFKSAADSDVCWKKFLPSDYNEIVSRSSSSSSDISSSFNLNDFTSKKQLYLHLCDHSVLLDGGKMSFNIDKKSGKKCFMIAAKELAIIWGDTPLYWTWQPHPDSRFAEVAELVDVCWLHIKGTIETRLLSPNTTYAAYIVVKFTDNAYGLERHPADVAVGFVGEGGNASGSRTVHLNHKKASGGQFPSERGDGWMEIELGEFYNDQGEDGEVQMTLTETKGGHWKSGLIVQGIELRPKVSIQST
ncbi:F-box protein pp2-b10 [Thalictrum thalictroides]|uniref:F-box protein pp2-b10 n=1 Tax=Thalictrum thalictroides TaxID=46969 RepID=A0A7J6WQ17_THATH|nr:F-box protein pp2-b10 [Thalictrum thalictroides]